MALLKKSQLLNVYNNRQSYLIDEAGERRFAKKKLEESAQAFSYAESYDIFLSHSFDDARVVKIVKELLEESGYSVYVDWIDDDHLDRGEVSPETAAVLRNRMNNCSSLIYLTSPSAEKSLWMPWELGYMDAKTGRVSVAPIVGDDEQFEGREYLGMYPYLDLTMDKFYVHKRSNEWVNLDGWMRGENPKVFKY
ncbi:toll/interleukin-1 receptor domain-containing protein [Marinobacter nauticus]|uniref:toll/interleukin-1 receptor domain-containing protein n=1 Tax=Marinobacter nauticus TaxID=2743 RepID=UPI000EB43B2B|nr:toll/interleukin-1 receptor domain-containing protein [Marinobacter nauticus]RKR72095.1 TIR domain-containing protein [Marinobacter nauticus]